MRSFICVILFALVSILLCCSANKDMKYSPERDFIYGEGTQEAADIFLAGQIAGDRADKSVAVQSGERYRNYFNRFIKETGLPEDSEIVTQFNAIISEFSPKPGTIDMKYTEFEIVEENIEEKDGIVRAKVIARTHIGYSDTLILEKIKLNEDVYSPMEKTKLNEIIQKHIEDMKKYSAK